MLLPDEEAAALHDKLFRAGGIVRGYLDHGSWEHGPGPTLLVARLPDRAR